MMYEVGRVCVKTAGKDAGKYCIILDKLEGNFVLVDGEIMRKRCNTAHLEPLDIVIEGIKKSSDKGEVLDALNSTGLIREKKKAVAKKEKKHTEKSTSTRKNAGKK